MVHRCLKATVRLATSTDTPPETARDEQSRDRLAVETVLRLRLLTSLLFSSIIVFFPSPAGANDKYTADMILPQIGQRGTTVTV